MPTDTPAGAQNEDDSHAESAAATAADPADPANGASSVARGRQAANPVERLLNWAGGAVADGARRGSVRSLGIADEPLPYGSEVDWARALDLAMRRRDSERARLDRIESKIAPIIAGTLAGLGLFVDKAASSFDYVLGALLLVPLAMLLLAFKTYEYIDTPSLDELVRTYERWPVTYVRSVVIGTADAVGKNSSVIDRKARDLNRTMAVLFIAIILVIAARAYEAVNAERWHSGLGHAASQPAGRQAP